MSRHEWRPGCQTAVDGTPSTSYVLSHRIAAVTTGSSPLGAFAAAAAAAGVAAPATRVGVVPALPWGTSEAATPRTAPPAGWGSATPPLSTSHRQSVDELSTIVDMTPRRVGHHATCITPLEREAADRGAPAAGAPMAGMVKSGVESRIRRTSHPRTIPSASS